MEDDFAAIRCDVITEPDGSLAGVRFTNHLGNLRTIALAPDGCTDLVMRLLQAAYRAGPALGKSPTSDLKCVPCHAIDVHGSLESDQIALAFEVGTISVPLLLDEQQSRQLIAIVSELLRTLDGYSTDRPH